MKTIFKYDLAASGGQLFYLPIGSRIIHFATQHGVPRMWVEHDIDGPREFRNLQIFATGQEMPKVLAVHLGTWISELGNLVLHLYELPLPADTNP